MAPAQAVSRSQKREMWRDAIDAATVEVFEALLGVQVEPIAERCQISELTAMVGFAGGMRGVMSLSCGKETAVAMTMKMLQADYSSSESQVWDAVGEICNVLAGRFKNGPPRMAENCMLSVPTVITGSNYCQHPLAGAGTVERCFRLGDSVILIALIVHDTTLPGTSCPTPADLGR